MGQNRKRWSLHGIPVLSIYVALEHSYWASAGISSSNQHLIPLSKLIGLAVFHMDRHDVTLDLNISRFEVNYSSPILRKLAKARRQAVASLRSDKVPDCLASATIASNISTVTGSSDRCNPSSVALTKESAAADRGGRPAQVCTHDTALQASSTADF